MMSSRGATLALASTLLVTLTGCAPAFLTPSALDEPATPSDSLPLSTVDPLQADEGADAIVADVDSSRLIGTWSGVDVYLMKASTKDYYCAVVYEDDDSWVQGCSHLTFTVELEDIAEVRVDIPETLMDDEWVRLDENVAIRKPG
ncbi:MAG: hypothetical protein LH605_09835 [Microbacteriaceae bacterium]|nr:hypothetical protein [Microbacteriaceae bacterium]